MKKQIFNAIVLSSVLALGVMTGCKKDKPAGPDSNEGMKVSLKANISPATPSALKVAGDQFESSDKVGLYMKKTGQALDATGAVYSEVNNLQMGIAGDGTLTSTPPVCYPLTGNVDFIAYYPHTGSVTNFAISVTAGNQAAALANEVLYANEVTNQAPSTAAVPLNFKYSLAKLTVNVTANGVLTATDFAGMTAQVDKLFTQANLSLVTGALSGHSSESAVSMLWKSSSTNAATFEALVLPTASKTVTYVFSAGGNSYSKEVTLQYEAAKEYTLNFAIDTTTPTGEVSLLETGITPRIVDSDSHDYTITVSL
jgi:hypothetical protein